jgi:hypothetical protein
MKLRIKYSDDMGTSELQVWVPERVSDRSCKRGLRNHLQGELHHRMHIKSGFVVIAGKHDLKESFVALCMIMNAV